MCVAGPGSGRLPEGFGVRDFAEVSYVSHETLARLEAYVALLIEWNARQNMVSKASLAEVWQRHVWDSAQLAPLLPEPAGKLADLGSGAGFPALVLAAIRPEMRVSLYEATAKKCRFLAEAAKVLNVEVDIRNTRIEDAGREGFDAVTARLARPWSFSCPMPAAFRRPRL